MKERLIMAGNNSPGHRTSVIAWVSLGCVLLVIVSCFAGWYFFDADVGVIAGIFTSIACALGFIFYYLYALATSRKA